MVTNISKNISKHKHEYKDSISQLVNLCTMASTYLAMCMCVLVTCMCYCIEDVVMTGVIECMNEQFIYYDQGLFF